MSAHSVEGRAVRLRARAFRRWIAGGAEPGGLRALAGDEAHAPLDAHPPTRQFARADELRP